MPTTQEQIRDLAYDLSRVDRRLQYTERRVRAVRAQDFVDRFKIEDLGELGDVSTFLDFKEVAVPANPDSGWRRVFANTATNKLSVRTSAGTTINLEYGDTEAIAAIEGEATLDLTGDVTIVGAGKSLEVINFKFETATELTISSGDIAVTQAYHRVDTESDAASDNLDGITGGADGEFLLLRPENDGRTVVVRHNQNAGTTKNILLAGGTTATLDDISDMLLLFYDATLDTNGAWIEVARTVPPAATHNILDGGTVHLDTASDGVTEGSLIIGNATPAWDELVISVPAANVRNVLGVDNGETTASWKAALDATNPAAVAAAAAAGTSLVFSHRDHAHKMGVITTKGDLLSWSTLPARLGVGANDTILMADSGQTTGLKWAAPASPSAGVDIGDSAAEGSADTWARSDHEHAHAAPAGGYPLNVAAAEADGTATTPARSDHVHKLGIVTTKGDVLTYSTVPARLGVGANDTILMADSGQTTGLKWAAPASPGSGIDIGDSAAEGTADTWARSDHQHAFTAPGAGYPVDIANVEADGSATTPARADHVHAHPSGLTADLHHDLVSLAVDAQELLNLSTQELGFVAKNANLIFAGPAAGGAADPTFRAMVAADLVAHGPAAHTTGYGTWKLIYTDGSGDQQEIALGADGTVLTGTGVGSAPAFEAASEHAHANDHPQVHGKADHTEHANWKVLYTDGSGDEQELALGVAGTYIRSSAVNGAPTMSTIDADVATAGAVMDSDFSPGEGFMRKTGAGTYTAHKSNLAAAAAPVAADDDADAGYSVGSIWIDTTNDNMYICVDSTNNAAVWLHLNAAAAVHKDTHDPFDGADALDTAVPNRLTPDIAQALGTSHSFSRADHEHQVTCDTPLEISVVVAGSEGTDSYNFARADHVHAINHAITDNHIVTVDGTTHAPAVLDYAKWTALGLEGRTDSQVLADLSAAATATFDWGGQDLSNIGAAAFASYLTLDEIADPGAGAVNKLRVYAIDVGGTTGLQITDSAAVDTTIVARTRRMSMTATQFAQAHYTRYADDDITSNVWGCRIPSDWVSGTDITVNVFLLAPANGQANMRSRIGVNKEGDAHSVSNIENFAICDITMVNGVVYAFTRTIPNASLEAGDAIVWLLQRRGSDASDTINDVVSCYEGAWIEYTAFF